MFTFSFIGSHRVQWPRTTKGAAASLSVCGNLLVLGFIWEHRISPQSGRSRAGKPRSLDSISGGSNRLYIVLLYFIIVFISITIQVFRYVMPCRQVNSSATVWHSAHTATRPCARAGEHSGGRVPNMSVIFEEILSHTHGNFEKENKVLGFSIYYYYYYYYY
jgi:hypothetical protein